MPSRRTSRKSSGWQESAEHPNAPDEALEQARRAAGATDAERARRVMQAMLKMVKLDIKVLKQAYEQG